MYIMEPEVSLPSSQNPTSYSYNKTNKMHYFSNLFSWRTLHVSHRFTVHHQESCKPGGSVGIATGYGPDGPDIETRCGRDFRHLSRPALGPTQPLYNGYRVFLGGKERPGRDAAPSPPSSAMVMKE